MVFLDTTGFLSQRCCKTVCARRNNCRAIRAAYVFSADHLWTIVLLPKEEDDSSLISNDTTICLPSGYCELLFLKCQGFNFDCCVWVQIASYCSSFFSLFIRDLAVSTTVPCLTYFCSPSHERLESLSSFYFRSNYHNKQMGVKNQQSETKLYQ